MILPKNLQEKSDSIGLIKRVKVQHKFVQISNDLARNKEMSWGARGLMTYILSLPDDWVVVKSHIQKQSTEGRYKFQNYFKELVDMGYIIPIEVRGEDGRFNGYSYIAYDIPFNGEVSTNIDSSPQAVLSATDITASGETATTNTIINTNKKLKTKKEKENVNSEKEFPSSCPYENLELETENNSIQTLFKEEGKVVPKMICRKSLENVKMKDIVLADLSEEDQYYFQTAEAFRLVILKYIVEYKGIVSHVENMKYKEVAHIRRLMKIDHATEEQLRTIHKHLSTEGYWWRKNAKSLKSIRTHANSILMNPPKQTSEDKKREILNNFKPFVPNY